MGPAEQRTETPLQMGAALPMIQVAAQSSEMPRPPERYGPKRSSRALAPGAKPRIWPQSCGPQMGSEYAKDAVAVQINKAAVINLIFIFLILKI